VHDGDSSCTLRSALDAAGVSLAAVADAAGVSKSRAAAWSNGEAEPHLRHIHDMPRGVRRAIGQALVDGAEPAVVPVPARQAQVALLGVLARVSALAVRVEEVERGGNVREAGAILRELEAARQELARVEAGVRAGMAAR
jgi:transcriptional regulator with XRE-family HTH domain